MLTSHRSHRFTAPQRCRRLDGGRHQRGSQSRRSGAAGRTRSADRQVLGPAATAAQRFGRLHTTAGRKPSRSANRAGGQPLCGLAHKLPAHRTIRSRSRSVSVVHLFLEELELIVPTVTLWVCRARVSSPSAFALFQPSSTGSWSACSVPRGSGLLHPYTTNYPKCARIMHSSRRSSILLRPSRVENPSLGRATCRFA